MGLRHETHALAHARLWREGGDILTRQLHMARAQFQHPEYGFHGGGLARTIGADDHGDLPFFHRDGAGVQDICTAITSGHRLADQKGLSHE